LTARHTCQRWTQSRERHKLSPVQSRGHVGGDSGYLRSSTFGQFIKAGEACARFFYEVANQFDGSKLRVHGIQHRRVREQVEARAMFDRRFDRTAKCFKI